MRGWVWLGAVNQEILSNAREVGPLRQFIRTTAFHNDGLNTKIAYVHLYASRDLTSHFKLISLHCTVPEILALIFQNFKTEHVTTNTSHSAEFLNAHCIAQQSQQPTRVPNLKSLASSDPN